MYDINNKRFQLWEYNVSHGTLLLRSPKNLEQNFNIDIKFFGVEFVSIPRFLNNIVISNIIEEDRVFLNNQLNKDVSLDKITVIESSNTRYYIVSLDMKVDKNNMDIFDSPFS